MTVDSPIASRAEEGYLLLADISGYTNFIVHVGEAHGVDFSEGIPPGFALMGALLDAVAEGVGTSFTVVKFEGDAVFAIASATDLDGRGSLVVQTLRSTYRDFLGARTQADEGRRDHVCNACIVVGSLDLKMVLHEGSYVVQTVQRQPELIGHPVNVVHRMLKSTVAETVNHRHYLHVSDVAATRLGLLEAGTAHLETYPDVGAIPGRVLDLAEAAPGA